MKLVVYSVLMINGFFGRNSSTKKGIRKKMMSSKIDTSTQRNTVIFLLSFSAH